MVERVALFRSSTAALITITILLTIVFSLTFIFSQGLCPFVIWMTLFLLCCFSILPIIILGKKRNQTELCTTSSFRLSHLLRWAQKIQIIQGGTEIVVKNHYITSNTTIKWYNDITTSIYNVVDGIKAGDTVLVDGVKLIII